MTENQEPATRPEPAQQLRQGPGRGELSVALVSRVLLVSAARGLKPKRVGARHV
jgi:hypothetical protein